jgi:hemerythrin HHE cation binding domain-containing protein
MEPSVASHEDIVRMSTNTSPELLVRSHDAIDGLSLDVCSAPHAAARSACFSEFAALVAMHVECLRRIVMPALASSRPSDTPALVLENLASVDRALLRTVEVDVASDDFNTRFEELAALLRLQFELETRLLFPMLVAGDEGKRVPLAQKIEIYGARAALEAAREVHGFQRNLR